MKPICVKCKKFFRPKRNGTFFEEGMPVRTGDGTEEWRPYKLWSGDLWECRGCGAQIIVGTAANPIAEHYQDDYAARVKQLQPAFRVDDC